MKKIFLTIFSLFSLLAYLAVPLNNVHASQYVSGPAVNVYQNSKDNYYVSSSNTVNVSAPLSKDLVIAGGDVTISGDITQSVIIASFGKVTINGNVGQNVRIAANTVDINGNIGQDATIIAAYLTVNKNIGGDLDFAGGNITVNGSVAGDLHITTSTFVLNGKVDGYANVTGDNIVVNSKAYVGKDLNYNGDAGSVSIAPSTVRGHINQIKSPEVTSGAFWSFSNLGLQIIQFLACLIASLLVFVLFPKQLTAFVNRSLREPLVSIFAGGCSVVLIPFLAIILLITIIGIPVVLIYGAFFITAMLIGGIVLGSILNRIYTKGSFYDVNWLIIIVGVFIACAVEFIPIFGAIFSLILFLITLGGILVYFSDFIRRRR